MLVWDIDPYLIHTSSISIRYYGVFFALGVLGSCYIFLWQWQRHGRSLVSGKKAVLSILIGFMLGARLGELLFYQPARFFADPITPLLKWESGLSSHGAAFGIILSLLLFSLLVRIPLRELLDHVAMPVMFTAIWVRLGNFFNSEIVGRTTDVPWAVRFPRFDVGLPLEQIPWRHPSQLYESGLNLSVLLILWFFDRRFGGAKRPAGLIFSLMLVIHYSGRFIAENYKTYQTLDPERYPLTMGQYLTIPLLFLGVIWTIDIWSTLRAKAKEIPSVDSSL